MPKRKYDHKKHLVEHAAIRARERYHVKVNTSDYEAIVAQIVQGKAKLIEDQVLKGVYDVMLRGKLARVVYHQVKRKVITFLPMPGTAEWDRHQTHTRGSHLRHGLPPYIPLDTDFWPF